MVQLEPGLSFPGSRARCAGRSHAVAYRNSRPPRERAVHRKSERCRCSVEALVDATQDCRTVGPLGGTELIEDAKQLVLPSSVDLLPTACPVPSIPR